MNSSGRCAERCGPAPNQKREHRCADPTALVLPQLEERIEKGPHPPQAVRLGWRVAYCSRALPSAGRFQHHRRRPNLFNVDEIAAIRPQGRAFPPPPPAAEPGPPDFKFTGNIHARAAISAPNSTVVGAAKAANEPRGGANSLMRVKIFICRGKWRIHAGFISRPMSLRIVQYNESILRRKGVKINSFDAALRELVEEMIETMHGAAGIGLAAQQIGRAIQLCVVDLRDADAVFNWELDGAKPPLDLFMPLTLVNPEVTVVKETPDTVYEEGCLSFPEIRGDIDRPDAIALKFHDEKGVPHSLTCDGLFSRCIQHEVDHLNGVLFIDRMEKRVRATVDEAVKTLSKETRAAMKAK